MYFCKYCEKDFSTKGSLTRHQNTSKSCLIPRENDRKCYTCKFCNLSFTQKPSLNSHLLKCPSKKIYELQNTIKSNKGDYQKEILSLKLKNKKLKKIIEEKDEEIIALKCKTSKADGKVEVYDKVCDKVLDKPTVTNTTTYIHPKLANLPITHIHPLTEDYVKKRVANGEYTFDHYRKGEDGIVDFINSITMCENDDGVVERNYVSTDASRDSFHRLVETKEWEKDKGGKFIDVILDTLENRVHGYQKRLVNEKIEFKDIRCPNGYDPQTVLENNHELNTGVVKSHGKERRTLRKKIKKGTSNKVAV
jgi:metal-responsive CopG/Arc/MetJ family transcriptional regulator